MACLMERTFDLDRLDELLIICNNLYVNEISRSIFSANNWIFGSSSFNKEMM